MKAYLHAARIAPKKANLIAKMVRGMNVPEAMEALQNTHKKGARYVEQLLKSAIANAEHNDKQKTEEMVIKTIVVNQGTAYRRGMPKARGQTRPFRKFLTHIAIELGLPEERATRTTRATSAKTKAVDGASSKTKSRVQTIKKNKSSDSSDSSDSSPSS